MSNKKDSKSNISEDQILVKAAKKNPRAFSHLYNKYYDQIFIFIYKRMENVDACGDLCSQVFLKAMSNLGRYKDQGFPFSSWLYRIAINEVNQFYRDNKRAIRTVSIEKAQVQLMAEEIGDGVQLEEALSALEAVMENLDEPSLTLIEMRFFDQKSFKEIGEILGISDGNAKIRTYRVLDQLKKELGKKQ